MNKHELLVPAGDMACLREAIFNGADAVYLGCQNFGARKFAKNFTNEEIIEAVKLAHLYGVKLYVTMNTLIKDQEVESFLSQIEFLYKVGIDAVIVQDFGMICLIRQMYPALEVHASTQANTSSQATAELFHRLGVKRVVFSREMSLKEINSITTPIETEVFIHGALCICYSGCCLMSSMLGTRSGNRGECAGSCRLPYTLEQNGKAISKLCYLLSTKELNTSTHIKDLLSSRITSFKLEGRMKSPEYVGFITRYYRALLDGTMLNLEEETAKLKTIFNREFTVGHLFTAKPKELMNPKTPNHIGLEIGKVIGITPEKIKIKLTQPLNQEDGIRFLNSNKGLIVNFLYDEQEKLTNSANDICYVDNKVGLVENDIVCKTLDHKLMVSLQTLPERKIPITIRATAKIGKPLELSAKTRDITIKVFGTPVAAATTSPLSKERLKLQLEKLGSTPFVSTETIIESDDNIFISIKEVNDLRRDLSSKLSASLMTNDINFHKEHLTFSPSEVKEPYGFTASVYTEEQLKTCLELNFKRIYVIDENLYRKYKSYTNVFYKVPRCSRAPHKYLQERNLISDYFDVDCGIGDYSLNVTNIYTLYYLTKLNISPVALSVELTDQEALALLANYNKTFKTRANVELLVYGRVENMLIDDNIFSIKENDYSMTICDIKHRHFPVFYDGTNTHILNYENKEVTNSNLLSQVSSLRFDFYAESATEIKSIVKNYR